MALLGIGVAMPPFQPFGFVEDFGKNQQRFDRIERLAFVEHFVIGIRAAAEKIGDHMAGADLGYDPRAQRIAGAVHRDQFDLGKLLAELVQQRLAAVTADVKVQACLPSLPRRRFSPNSLARPAWHRRQNQPAPKQGQQRIRMINSNSYHVYFPSRPFMNSLAN